MTQDRRSVLAALGLAFPFVFTGRARAAAIAPVLSLRSFEEAVRDAFPVLDTSGTSASGEAVACRRIEVGHSDAVTAGLQSCHNDRTFAGHPAGQLRIVRTGSAPGPLVRGVRLYVATVDVALSSDPAAGESRPFDFATVPPAPVLTAGDPARESVKETPLRTGTLKAPQQAGPYRSR